MNIVFFIKSATVYLKDFTIKDIPGSSGRLDVISRCILAALLRNDRFEKKVKIWVFLDNFETLIFDPESFDYDNFPLNEIKLTSHLVDILLNRETDMETNPLRSIQIVNLSILKAINKFKHTGFTPYVLKEDGKNFFALKNEINDNSNLLFIIGSQKDDFLDSEELSKLNIPTLSIGNQSYLASSVIRLLKLNLLEL